MRGALIAVLGLTLCLLPGCFGAGESAPVAVCERAGQRCQLPGGVVGICRQNALAGSPLVCQGQH